MLAAGDTFFDGEHLWVVISDPRQDAEKVVLANLTSWKSNKDQSCVLQPGDHPFITKQTCVAYRYARAEKLSLLLERIKDGGLEPREKMMPDVLNRIRRGAMESKFAAFELQIVLGNQDLA